MSTAAGAALSRAFARAAKLRPAAPAIITCAVSGGIVTGNENQPFTLQETVDAALAAADAGACVLHIHARSVAGGMSSDASDYESIASQIRAAGRDVLINFTTDGEGLEEGSVPASLAGSPDVATVVCGSTNFGPGDGMLSSPGGALRRLVGELAGRGVAPEYECFDLGMVATAAELLPGNEGPRGIVHLIAGSLAGLPALPAAIMLVPELLPDGVPWAATSVRDHFSTMALALALGGHVRTGLEDVVNSAPGQQARSNAELVERARSMCEAIGRPVATAEQARSILGLSADTLEAEL